MKKTLAFIGISVTALAFAGYVFAASLVIADFDSGDKPNNIGGDFGAWDKDPNDATQGCKNNFNSDVKHGAKGYSLQLDYDVDSPNPAYNGFWMKLQNQDISKYSKVTFWVKGDETAGYSPKIKLELKNTKGEVGRYTLTNVSKDWQEVSVPLVQFAGLKDTSSMTEFVVVFDDITCKGKKQGTIYLDDIAFIN